MSTLLYPRLPAVLRTKRPSPRTNLFLQVKSFYNGLDTVDLRNSTQAVEVMREAILAPYNLELDFAVYRVDLKHARRVDFMPESSYPEARFLLFPEGI